MEKSRSSIRESGNRIRRAGAWIRGLASPKAIAVALALYLLSLAALQLADARVAVHAPNVTKPDLHFGYTHADLIDKFSAYGPEGREAYRVSTLVDSVMPAFFMIVTLLVVAYAAPRWQGLLSIAPVMFFVLDLVENAIFLVMLSRFPEIAPSLTGATRLLTMVKLSAFFVAMPTLVLGLIAAGARRLARRFAST